MKKNETRAILGLTQQEIAMLLKVSRSKWSMYECGARNLPSEANLRLLEMMMYMLTPEAQALQNVPNQKQEESKTKRILEHRLKENEYQLRVIARKITATQEKVAKYAKAVQLMHFLNLPEQVEKALAPRVLDSITAIAVRNFNENNSQLSLLLIDQELLQVQQEVLEKAMLTFETS
jgi:transcriptional regulator with XRE-family HTH domain